MWVKSTCQSSPGWSPLLCIGFTKGGSVGPRLLWAPREQALQTCLVMAVNPSPVTVYMPQPGAVSFLPMWKESCEDPIIFHRSAPSRYNLFSTFHHTPSLSLPFWEASLSSPRLYWGSVLLGNGTRASTVVGFLRAACGLLYLSYYCVLIPKASPFDGFCSESLLLTWVVVLSLVAGGSLYCVNWRLTAS